MRFVGDVVTGENSQCPHKPDKYSELILGWICGVDRIFCMLPSSNRYKKQTNSKLCSNNTHSVVLNK